MKVTIKDVAKAVGVSPSTVSRALRNNNRISQEVRDRVHQVAQELDFHPNQMARSLVDRKTSIIGIVFPGDAGQSLGVPFHSAVLQGLGCAASERHYHLLLATGSEAVTSADAGRNLAESGYVSGLVLLAAEDAPARLPDIPMVIIGRPLHNETPYFVDNDNVKVGREATEYLMQRGHRRILFLGYDHKFVVTTDRYQGYEQALTAAGIALRPDWIVSSQFNLNSPDNDRLRQIFAAPDRPTAVVCMDDNLAIGLTGLLGEIGLSAPQDVSIISFNNIEAGRHHSPALTSFDVNPHQLGVAAMNLMLDVISGVTEKPTFIEVPFTLKERDSVLDISGKDE